MNFPPQLDGRRQQHSKTLREPPSLCAAAAVVCLQRGRTLLLAQPADIVFLLSEEENRWLQIFKVNFLSTLLPHITGDPQV